MTIRMMIRRGLGTCVAAVAFAGCADLGETPDAPISTTFVDSLGVEIVYSARPQWDPTSAWRLAPEPFLQIGSLDGAEPYLLSDVMGVVRLDDGRIAVAMLADNTIRFYDSEGRYLQRVGGSGEGPREFVQLRGLSRAPGRLIGVQGSRFKVFDETSTDFIEEIHLRAMRRPFTRQGLFSDGSALAEAYPQSDDAPDHFRLGHEVFIMPATAVRVTRGGRVDTVGVFPARTMVPVPGLRPTDQAFGPGRYLHAAGDRFFQAYSDDFDIAERAMDGSVTRRIRRRWDPIPVTDSDRGSYYEETVGRLAREGTLSASGRQQRQTRFDAMIFPEHHPAHGILYVDREDNLWVMRTKTERSRDEGGWVPVDETPTSWDVFDPDGVWLGGVELPARFRMREIGGDYVAGVWKDDLDVEFVQLYRLVKPER